MRRPPTGISEFPPADGEEREQATEPATDTPSEERRVEASERTIRILADLEAGLTYRTIAARQGCGLATVARVAARLETSREAARKYLALHALEAADDWLDASREAAKKGDHRPAKDMLLHLGEVDPLPEKQSGGGVTIIVGDGTKPIGTLPVLTTMEINPATGQVEWVAPKQIEDWKPPERS